jgi:ABC-2 type transport system permease protein
VVTLARREFTSYFRQPAGWIIIALYLFLASLIFCLYTLVPGRPATMRDFFAISGWLLLPVAPAITMRLISEELRSGTIEALLTSPAGPWSLVLGKFIGACAFLLAMLVPTGVYVAVLSHYSTLPLDAGPIISGYICLALVGLLYLGIGTLASSLTSNSTLAFMLALFAILGLMFAEAAGGQAPPGLRELLFSLSLSPRLADFAKGVIDTGHVAFFVSGAMVCVVGAAIVMELRRWR